MEIEGWRNASLMFIAWSSLANLETCREVPAQRCSRWKLTGALQGGCANDPHCSYHLAFSYDARRKMAHGRSINSARELFSKFEL